MAGSGRKVPTRPAVVITGHNILNHSPWTILPRWVVEHIGYAPDYLPAPLVYYAFCSAAWNEAGFQIVIY